MEATDDVIRKGGDWFALKFKARLLVIAALAVGIGLATPAVATSPQVLKFVQRNPVAAKAYAQTQLHKYGWKSQWACLLTLWTNESNWRPEAKNHSSVRLLINGKWVRFYAGGIPQRLGLSPKASVEYQIHVGLEYIKGRYGTPCKALRWWNSKYWY